MTSSRLYLIRHGRTDANVRGALDSVPPGEPLDETGHAQAHALAARLRGAPIRAVYASHAIRAQQTAAPLAAALDLGVLLLDGIHEVFVGDLEGREDRPAREAFEVVYQRFWTGDLGARMPGGESAAELRARFLPAVDKVMDGAEGDVVLVSHGAAIRLAAAALLGDTALTSYVPNTGVVVLRPGGPRWELEHWDPAPRRPRDVTAGGTPA
ncbi:histidine phosphatase family protein [Pseudonocardia sp.]|uniref:histidine phosphatase family protein n=1 Tax=Pseudonocardia sp. TaxID=60912 RepID=UPI003D1153E8